MNTQIPVPFQVRETITLDRFVVGQNQQVIDACIQAQEPFIFLWGETGSGKSHLLQACCNRAAEQNQTCVYLPLAELKDESSDMLQGLETIALVCLDDVDALADNDDWQLALFHLFNRCRDNDCQLILSASQPPSALPFTLPDLLSRMGWGLTLRVRPLSDPDKKQALQAHARSLGMDLSPEVMRYLLAHFPRDLTSLWALISELDHATLVAKRKLTIPFIKSFIATSNR